MTRAEYHRLAPHYSRAQVLIDQIPQNVNRAGKTYRRLVTKIRNEYGKQERN